MEVKKEWKSIATAVLTAATAVLSAFGVIGAEDAAQLLTAGGAAVTGVAGFVTAILAVVEARKRKAGE